MTHHRPSPRNPATLRTRSAPTRHRGHGGRQLLALVGLLGALAVLAVAISGVAHAQTTVPPTPGTTSTGTPSTGLPLLPLSPTTTPTTAVSGDQPPPISLDPPMPSPSSAPASPPPNPPSNQCAWWQIGCQALNAINQWFIDTADQAVAPVLDLFSHSVLVTPDVTTVPQITGLWTVTRWIANSVFVLFIIAGGFVIAAHETLQTRHALREIAPRLVVGFLAVNTSLSVIGQAITTVNALTTALLGQDSMDGVTTNIKTTILGQLHQDALYAVLIALIVLVLTVILLASYAVRIALLVIVVAAAPLALACHASPYTEGIARLWWRILIALLTIPALQAITLIVFVKIFFSPSASDVLSVGGSVMGLIISGVLVFILIKIPNWVLKYAGLQRRSAIASIIKVALLAKGLGMLTGGRLGTRPNTPGPRRPPASGSRRGTTPPPGPSGSSGSSALPPPDPDTPPPAGDSPTGRPTGSQSGGHRQRGHRPPAGQRDAATRARAAAIRAWSTPTNDDAPTRASAVRATSSPPRSSGTSRSSAAPPRMTTPAMPTTPRRTASPARRGADSPLGRTVAGVPGPGTPRRGGTATPARAPVPRPQTRTRRPSTPAATPPPVLPPRTSPTTTPSQQHTRGGDRDA